MKKILLLASILLLTVSACSPKKDSVQADKKDIIVGVAAGPYGDMFAQAIKPELEKKGYKVDIKEFSDYVQPNKALANKEIDVNLFQHSAYLNKFKEDHNLSLEPIAVVPTAGAGIFSKKYTSLEDLPDNATVTIANDVTNLSRALRILQASGLITFKDGVDPSIVTVEDIDTNPKNLVITEVEAPQTPRAIDSVDISVVNGNYAIGAGLDLSKALYNEVLSENLKNVIVVRSEDVSSTLAKDIQEAVASDFFKGIIDDPNGQFKSFQKPEKQL